MRCMYCNSNIRQFKTDLYLTRYSKVSPKCNRLDNVVRGKGKKGAQVAGDKSVMAVIETEGGARFKVLSNVRGKVSNRGKCLYFSKMIQ